MYELVRLNIKADDQYVATYKTDFEIVEDS